MRTFFTIQILLFFSAGAMAQTDSRPAQADIAKLRAILSEAPNDGATQYQLGSLLMDNNLALGEAATHFDRVAELEFQPLGAANRFPCQADERHHAFDFWIGEWNVTQNGQFAGTNSIEAILGHCVLFEQWESATGSFGKSFNYYDPAHDHWRQIWIGDSGTFIEFTGTARDGGIFYTAETRNPADASVTLHRFEFTQLDDGVVRQFWETSADNGESWQTIWDGMYERKSAAED